LFSMVKAPVTSSRRARHKRVPKHPDRVREAVDSVTGHCTRPYFERGMIKQLRKDLRAVDDTIKEDVVRGAATRICETPHCLGIVMQLFLDNKLPAKAFGDWVEALYADHARLHAHDSDLESDNDDSSFKEGVSSSGSDGSDADEEVHVIVADG